MMLTMKLAGPAAASGLEAAGRGEQARERHPTYDDDAVKILPENGVNQVLSEDLLADLIRVGLGGRRNSTMGLPLKKSQGERL